MTNKKATFYIYKGRDSRKRKQVWRWRLVGRNGRRLATSGEGYTNFSDLVKALKLVVRAAREPVVEDTTMEGRFPLGYFDV